jgi:hypothetical protein
VDVSERAHAARELKESESDRRPPPFSHQQPTPSPPQRHSFSSNKTKQNQPAQSKEHRTSLLQNKFVIDHSPSFVTAETDIAGAVTITIVGANVSW